MMVVINPDSNKSNSVEMDTSEITDKTDEKKISSAPVDVSESVTDLNNSSVGAVRTISSSSINISKKKKLNKAAAQLKRKQEKLAAKKGTPHSGRWWKDPELKRFSSIMNPDTRPKNNLQRAQSLRNERKIILQRKEEIMSEQKARKEHIKERKKINEERTLENQKKAERVQIIKNPSSIKKMKKKQLRQIETRDLNTLTAKNIQN